MTSTSPLHSLTQFRNPRTTIRRRSSASSNIQFLNHNASTTKYFNPKPSCSHNSAAQSSPLWTVYEIAEAVDGRILKWGPPGTISTDTRTLQPGQWFFAITGQNFDAHDFITPKLSSMGCVGVIGNRCCDKWEKGFVKIEGKCMNSLQKMAIYARNRFCGCLIGLTGSVGKTTTRAMIALALENLGVVYQTPGNWNNEIGVALTLIGIPKNAGIAVMEFGMSEKGDILELARNCRPSIRLILNVSASHLENFATLEDISLAKGEILSEAKAGDVCILNGDDPLVMNITVPPVGVTKVLYGKSMECDVRLVTAESIDDGLGVRVVLDGNSEMVEFEISTPGLHLAHNACAAAAVASVFGVSLAQIGRSLSRFTPIHMRSELESSISGIKIINDVYNASPASTKAAIALLKGTNCKGKKVIILGDMLELGPNEINFHETVLQHCIEAKFDVVGLAGRRFKIAANNMKLDKVVKVIHANDSEKLALKIVKLLNCEDMVLVKGSRAMQMEKIVEAIKSLPQ